MDSSQPVAKKYENEINEEKKKTKTSANVEAKKEFQQASCAAVRLEAQASRWSEGQMRDEKEGIKTYKMIS